MHAGHDPKRVTLREAAAYLAEAERRAEAREDGDVAVDDLPANMR